MMMLNRKENVWEVVIHHFPHYDGEDQFRLATMTKVTQFYRDTILTPETWVINEPMLWKFRDYEKAFDKLRDPEQPMLDKWEWEHILEISKWENRFRTQMQFKSKRSANKFLESVQSLYDCSMTWEECESLYYVARSYGGPEEGGWYYDHYNFEGGYDAEWYNQRQKDLEANRSFENRLDALQYEIEIIPGCKSTFIKPHYE